MFKRTDITFFATLGAIAIVAWSCERPPTPVGPPNRKTRAINQKPPVQPFFQVAPSRERLPAQRNIGGMLVVSCADDARVPV